MSSDPPPLNVSTTYMAVKMCRCMSCLWYERLTHAAHILLLWRVHLGSAMCHLPHLELICAHELLEEGRGVQQTRSIVNGPQKNTCTKTTY